MATNPNYPGVTLTRAEIAWIANDAGFKRDARVWATAIAWRESRGVTNAFRPAAQNPSGGNDRGLVQFNDKAFPNISDKVAYNPRAAMLRMRYIAQGESIRPHTSDKDLFGPWNVGRYHYDKKRGESVFSAADEQAARDAVANPVDPTARLQAAGINGTDPELDSIADNVIDAAGDVVAGPLDAFKGLATGALAVLRTLIDPAWWKRIGVGVLGVLLIAAAVAVVARSQIMPTGG